MVSTECAKLTQTITRTDSGEREGEKKWNRDKENIKRKKGENFVKNLICNLKFFFDEWQKSRIHHPNRSISGGILKRRKYKKKLWITPVVFPEMNFSLLFLVKKPKNKPFINFFGRFEFCGGKCCFFALVWAFIAEDTHRWGQGEREGVGEKEEKEKKIKKQNNR